MRAWIVAVCLALAGAAHAQVALQEGVGPFQFGMSYDAAREFSSHSNGEGALVARDPVRLADITFDATVQFSRLSLLSQISLTHRSRADARRCRAMHAQLIAELEPRYGAFDPFSLDMPSGAQQTHESVGTQSTRIIYRPYGFEASNVNRIAGPTTYLLYRAEDGACSLRVVLGPIRALVVDPLPSPSAAELQAARQATAYRWQVRPNLDAAYPARARDRGQEGRAEMSCIVRAHGQLACVIVSEDPPNWGFGEGARVALANARVHEHAPDGSSIVGARIRVIVRFALPG